MTVSPTLDFTHAFYQAESPYPVQGFLVTAFALIFHIVNILYFKFSGFGVLYFVKASRPSNYVLKKKSA